MIQFNIQSAPNNFYSYEAIIKYLGKKDGLFGDWMYRINDNTDYNKFEKEIKREIKLHKGVYEVVINKLIWKTQMDHDIYNKIYCDPITGYLVMPSAEHVWKANEVYTYAIQNNKAKLILER